MSDLSALREAVAKIAPCPKCGGDGFLFIVTNSSHAEHDAGCDGSCRYCPVEVPDQDIGPCDCVFAQANLTEAELWRLASALPALLDEVERLRKLSAHYAAANFMYEAEKAEPGMLLARLQKAEAALATTEEARDRWHQKYTVEAQARKDETQVLGDALTALRDRCATAEASYQEAQVVIAGLHAEVDHYKRARREP